MKIFCVGRNYAAHAAELNNPIPERPVIFTKPQTALVKEGKPFFYPEFSSNVHFEGELVVRIGKVGKHIGREFANLYIDSYTLGIDFTARDLQDDLKAKGLPWDLAKGFDRAAPIGDWIPYHEMPEGKPLNFLILKNGEIVQQGDTSLMLYSIETLIVFISQFFTLQKGDIIFTGTPAGVGPVAIGDKLEGILEGRPVLKCPVK